MALFLFALFTFYPHATAIGEAMETAASQPADGTATERQGNLLNAMADFARAQGNDVVHRLAEPLLKGGLERIHVPPKDHPAVPYLPELEKALWPEARDLFKALMAASPSLAWQITYKLEDGFGQDYLDRYAWCDIIGPEGIYLSNEYRIGFGFWREGLFYPPHSHGPEEIYWVLSGTGLFKSGDAEPVSKGPGSIVHHEPWVWHSIDMSQSSVLVFFLWKGENLHKRSDFGE